MLLRPIFPMFFFFPPLLTKPARYICLGDAVKKREKMDPLAFSWLFFQWLTSINMNSVTRYVVFHMASHSFITLPQPSLVIGNTALEKLCCSSTWAFNTSITLQSASTSNFSHSKQSIIFPYCPLKYVSATTSKKVKVLVILLICLSHWKCYSCSNRDDDFEELSLLNIFQAIKHLQRPVNGIFLKIELQIPLKLSFHNH